MGRYLFRLPDIGEGVVEAEVMLWYVAAGDTVKLDQALLDVMTDKAVVDMTSPVEGVVVATHGEVGEMVPVGSVLVELDVEGEGNAAQEGDPAKAPPAEAAAAPVPPAAHEAPQASPATRRRARDGGIALDDVHGSGPGGRITGEDLDAHIAANEAAPPVGIRREGVSETKIVGLRRKIAETMEEARRIPHIGYVEECDVTQLEALRADLNAHRRDDQPRLTVLPFLMRALVRALPDFPQINARYDDREGVLRAYEGVHIGIATQTPGGLMVPVVRHAEALDLWACARELARVAQAARSGKAPRDELSGSTITLTSLGPIGGLMTTPVINPPEVAILAPNRIAGRPVVQGSFVAVRKVMNLSSSFDHRIVDGWDAAQFIQRIKRLLEHPALIFMD